MARRINMLSATKINALKTRGFYADGGGLYVQVAPGGSKSWVFRYKGFHPKGYAQDMGLGSVHTINLAEARTKATDCRKLLLDGINPIAARNAERTARQIEAAKAMTFDQCSAAYLADNADSWRNAKHRQQWTSTLATYVSPILGALPVQAVDTDVVTKVLRPIWQAKQETAKRVRGRIETVLNWAKAQGYRTGENPARWKGHLDHILPKRSKGIKHLASLPYAEIAAFMGELRNREGITTLALEFTILTAVRTNEALRAEWSEFDLKNKVWTIPGERMKAGRQHRVPLSDRALAIVEELAETKRNAFVFCGDDTKPISNESMLALLRRMRRDVTTHGFRSTFKDWARERTSFPNEVSEAALAHVIGDKTEAAYARGDVIEKRRQLMTAWSAFCAAPAGSGDIVAINRKIG